MHCCVYQVISTAPKRPEILELVILPMNHIEAASYYNIIASLVGQLPGVYCPALYHVEYVAKDGPISSITPIHRWVPESAAKDHLTVAPIAQIWLNLGPALHHVLF